MPAMTMDQLEQKFSEMYEKKAAAERERVTNEIKAAGSADDAKIKAAVDARLKEMEVEESKAKANRAETMEILERAYMGAASKGVELKPEQVVGQMLVSATKAMEVEGRKSGYNRELAAKQAETLFPESKALHGIMRKELTAGTPSSGGFTIPQVLIPDYIKFLYANTILDKLGIQKVPMPAGNFSIPRMDATSTVGWVDEIAATNITGETFGAVNLRAKKLKAMTAISNTLLRQNVVGLDSWVSQDLQYVSRIALDQAFLYGAGTEFTPRGLAYTTNIQTSGTTSTAFGLTTPIDMLALLEQANVPMLNVKWILNPIGKSWILGKAFSSGPWAWAREMLEQKTLAGNEFITSSTVAKDPSSSAYADFWLGDFSQALWGVAYDLSIELSREGTYQSGGTTYSAFDKDITLIRIIAEHDFGTRQPKAFVQGTYSKV